MVATCPTCLRAMTETLPGLHWRCENAACKDCGMERMWPDREQPDPAASRRALPRYRILGTGIVADPHGGICMFADVDPFLTALEAREQERPVLKTVMVKSEGSDYHDKVAARFYDYGYYNEVMALTARAVAAEAAKANLEEALQLMHEMMHEGDIRVAAQLQAAEGTVAALQKKVKAVAAEIAEHLDADRDAKALKLAWALAGRNPRYRADVDEALRAVPSQGTEEAEK